jgi:hypothetical protein
MVHRHHAISSYKSSFKLLSDLENRMIFQSKVRADFGLWFYFGIYYITSRRMTNRPAQALPSRREAVGAGSNVTLSGFGVAELG